MIRQKTITTFVHRIEEVINSGLTRNAYAALQGFNSSYFSTTFTKILNAYKLGEVSIEDFNRVTDLMTQIDSKYSGYKQISPDEVVSYTPMESELIPTDEEAGDDRNEVEFERDDRGFIQYYRFKVLRKDKEPLVGKLSRDEANTIYRLYSYYGMSITQREVSRYFPEWSLMDFKRILRVFNITKASAPFAPHVIEENSTEQLLEMQMREKENDFLRKLEVERVKQNEKLLTKYALENAELKKRLADGKELISSLEFPDIKPCKFEIADSDKSLIIWLSDIHTGAFVSTQSIYSNPYDKEEMLRRFERILTEVGKLHEAYGSLEKIIVCNLGDSLDGMDRQTTRRDHYLPQNMTNKEQMQTFMDCMVYFMTGLCEFSAEVEYYCVGESNHDGDFGYVTNMALAAALDKMYIKATVFDKFIGEFSYKGTTYILCHGKDNKDMFKNLPLTLNEKTENFINEYLDNKGITGNIVFVKGDLHQSATTYGRRFTYKSVGSLFGSSEWIHKNFGNTKACCDYSVVDDSGRLDGRIILN